MTRPALPRNADRILCGQDRIHSRAGRGDPAPVCGERRRGKRSVQLLALYGDRLSEVVTPENKAGRLHFSADGRLFV